MSMLAANWPDKQLECSASPLIDLEPRASGQQGGSVKHRERLSEETSQLCWINKRSDSPNPDKILEAVNLWKLDCTMEGISKCTGIPQRTVRRYLKNLGYKRDYSYVSKMLSGRPKSDSHKLALSVSRKQKGIAKKENNPNWKGGIENPKIQIWNTTEYKTWRTSIFVRDNYICKGCGIKNEKGLGRTVQLEAHHILPRRDFPHLTFDISNGITLCKPCHDKTRQKEYLSVNIWRQRVQ